MNTYEYIDLKREARQECLAGHIRECQIALDVAGQFYRLLTPKQRKLAEKILAEGA